MLNAPLTLFKADAADADTNSTESNLLSTEDDKVDIVLSIPAVLVANAPLTLFNAPAADAETNSTLSNLLSTDVENVLNTDALTTFDCNDEINTSCAASLTATAADTADNSASVA